MTVFKKMRLFVLMTRSSGSTASRMSETKNVAVAHRKVELTLRISKRSAKLSLTCVIVVNSEFVDTA